MGETSDGIAAADWDRVHELAVAIVNAEVDSPEERYYRTTLLNYLDELTQKYGELPSVLATRADYVGDPAEKERLLLRGSEVAIHLADTRNICLIALSLADFYATERLRSVAARVWLDKARDHMLADDESSWKESRRIERQLDQL